MDHRVSIGVRSIVVTGVVLLGLLAAYLLGGAGGASPPARAADTPAAPAAPAAGQAARRTLTMVGRGEAVVIPDQLGFSLRVELTRPDLDTALAAANRTMHRVLGALTPHGVARRDVQTTGLSMSPVYDYHSYAPPTLRGYPVSQRASVLVRELAEGGAAVSAAVDAGGNDVRVGDIRLTAGDPDAGMARARDAAVAMATAKAEQYAAATGQELGDVVTLRELHTSHVASTVPGRLSGLMRGAADLPVPMPVRAGRDRLSVTVQVVWEFAPRDR